MRLLLVLVALRLCMAAVSWAQAWRRDGRRTRAARRMTFDQWLASTVWHADSRELDPALRRHGRIAARMGWNAAMGQRR